MADKPKTAVLRLEPGTRITLAGREYEIIRNLGDRVILRTVPRD